MPARKSTAKRPVAKKTTTRKKRVSTAEPKTIIKRKKSTARRGATAKTARAGRRRGEVRGETRARATASKKTDDAELIKKVAALLKKGLSIREIAEKIGVSNSKAKRLAMAAQMPAKDKVVGNTAEVGAKIVKLRDAGVSWPKIRVQTGLGGMTIRRLYEEASGKDWRSSGNGAKSTAKKTTAKRTGRKTTAAKGTTRDRTRSKRTAKKPTTAKRGRKRQSVSEALSEANEAKKTSRGKKVGRPKGRRALRDHNATLLKDVVWDSDSKLIDVKGALKGKTITVEREGLRSQDVRVRLVKDAKVSDRSGRVFELVDEDNKTRYIASREITAIRG